MTSAQQETFAMFDTILLLQPKVTKAKGLNRDYNITDVANDILKRLPEKIDMPSNFDTATADSMTTVLIQEIVRYTKLLRVINSSLKELLKALKGLVVMSAQFEELANSLYNNQVPTMWTLKSYSSLKPLGSWVVDLENRIEFIKSWIANGQHKVFWISGFFFPQAFLTGVLQTYARKYQISIDTLSFDFKVLGQAEYEIKSGPEDGVYIRGLYLEGARWNSSTMQLDECKPKELYTEMPIVWLRPVANRKKAESGNYGCPVYKTLRRAGTLSTTGHSTNYILTIELPTDKNQQHWIKRGVALICGLNY